VLVDDLKETDDFIRRAAASDQNTLERVGMSFPRDLTPAYRGKLVEAILPWSQMGSAVALGRAGR